MTKRDQSYLDLMQELFRAELKPVVEDVAEIKKKLNGNGKRGIVDRLDELEYCQKSLTKKIGFIAAGAGALFALIWEVGKEYILRLKLNL